MNRIKPKTEFPPGYLAAIERIAAIVRAWGKDHPGAASIQFNYPNTVMLAATITDAIENKFISVDAGGRELVDKLNSELTPEPTAFMLRVALDSINQNEIRI